MEEEVVYSSQDGSDSLDFQSCASFFADEEERQDDATLSPPPPPPPPDAMLLEQVLFFGLGLGSSLGYIATLSSLVYFKILYGPNSFVDLNLAVFLPLLPISLAQARWDQYYDQQFQSRRTFLVRGMVGFSLTLLGTIQMALKAEASNNSLLSLIGNALLQGIGGAILYGTLNQMASFVVVGGGGTNHDGRIKSTVSAGVQSSALVVLAVSTATGFGTHNAERFSLFLWSIIGIESLCFAMFLWLLIAGPSVAASMIRRDSSIRLFEDEPFNDDDSDNDNDALLNGERRSSVIELSFHDLWKFSRSCCLVLIVTLIPSFLVGSWFTRIQTDWIALAQVLFYVRIGADFMGRLVTFVVPPRSIACLTWTASLRLVPVVLFFIHSTTRHDILFFGYPSSDMISIVLVAVVSFLSGYLVTGCFQLAPQGLPGELRATNLAKQASLLTVFFSIGAIGGLMSSFALIALGV
jgi:hypothetical protein